MTSRTSANTDRSARRQRDRRGGFTLVELLVVIGIIVVLAGLLLPALNRVYRQSIRTAQAQDLQAIATALEAYKQDWGDYPRVRFATGLTRADYSVSRSGNDMLWRPNPQTGAEMLCFALMGLAPATDAVQPPAMFRARQDGADGPGFRPRRTLGADGVVDPPNDTTPDDVTGKIYPSYLSPDRFKVGAREDAFTTDTSPDMVLHFNIIDRFNMPVLYFPASPSKPNVTVTPAGMTAKPYVDSAYANTMVNSESCRYDGDDNLVWFYDDPYAAMGTPGTFTNAMNSQNALKRLRGMLNDIHNDAMDPPAAAATSTPDGVIQRYETPIDLPYLLWSAGPDERFGPVGITAGATLTDPDRSLLQRCDDVTNFRP